MLHGRLRRARHVRHRGRPRGGPRRSSRALELFSHLANIGDAKSLAIHNAVDDALASSTPRSSRPPASRRTPCACRSASSTSTTSSADLDQALAAARVPVTPRRLVAATASDPASLGLVETQRVVLFTEDDPLVLDVGRDAGAGRGRLRDLRRRSTPTRAQRRLRLPRADGRRARRRPPRRPEPAGLVGHADRPGQAASTPTASSSSARTCSAAARARPARPRPTRPPASRTACASRSCTVARPRHGAPARCSRTSASRGRSRRSAARSAACRCCSGRSTTPTSCARGARGLRQRAADRAEHRLLAPSRARRSCATRDFHGGDYYEHRRAPRRRPRAGAA